MVAALLVFHAMGFFSGMWSVGRSLRIGCAAPAVRKIVGFSQGKKLYYVIPKTFVRNTRQLLTQLNSFFQRTITFYDFAIPYFTGVTNKKKCRLLISKRVNK